MFDGMWFPIILNNLPPYAKIPLSTLQHNTIIYVFFISLRLNLNFSPRYSINGWMDDDMDDMDDMDEKRCAKCDVPSPLTDKGHAVERREEEQQIGQRMNETFLIFLSPWVSLILNPPGVIPHPLPLKSKSLGKPSSTAASATP